MSGVAGAEVTTGAVATAGAVATTGAEATAGAIGPEVSSKEYVTHGNS